MVLNKKVLAEQNIILQLAVFFFYLLANVHQIGFGGIFSSILKLNLILFILFIALKPKEVTFKIGITLIPHILFISWIFFKIYIDIFDFRTISSVLFSTSGGVLLFFVFGMQLNICINYLYEIAKNKRSLILIYYVSVSAACLLFLLMLGRLRDDIFLFDNINGEYQRVGNFLVVFFIILSKIWIMITQMIVSEKLSIYKSHLLICSYISVLGLLFTFSQLLQSNSATAVIFGVGICTLFVKFLNSKPYRSNLSIIQFIISSFFISRLLSFFAIILIVIFLLLTFLSLLNNFHIYELNLFNFGTGKMSSIYSRLMLLDQYGIEQLAHAPWLGAYNISEIVTGKSGNYPHSLIISVIAKLGVVGLLLLLLSFSTAMISTVQIRKYSDRKLYFVLSIFDLFILFFVFLFGCLTVDLSWSVYWFALGFVGRNIVVNTCKKQFDYNAV